MADFNKVPDVEQLLGAGFKFEEAAAVLKYAKEESWPPNRVWSLLLMSETKTFPKVDQPTLAAHLKRVNDTDQPSEMG